MQRLSWTHLFREPADDAAIDEAHPIRLDEILHALWALSDIAGFSHHSPLEQVTQLNSLSYSVHTAYSKLMDKQIEIRFARTNTGDGFYIWNRDRGIDSNVDLYQFMHLVLAENAVARSRAVKHIASLLRTCFHVGGHYEFYQSEGLYPTTFSYIVGDVTIELRRMIEQAKAGQILIGDFRVPMHDPAAGEALPIDTVTFIERCQPRRSSLNDLVLGDDRIEAIRCYLTGGRQAGGYAVSRYLLTDKHGYTRRVFNAKVNIHRGTGIPNYLGLQEAELNDFCVLDPTSRSTGTLPPMPDEGNPRKPSSIIGVSFSLSGRYNGEGIRPFTGDQRS